MVQPVLIKSAVVNDVFLTWTNEERDEAKGPDGTVSVSSANGLVGAEIAYRYRLIPRAVFRSVRPLHSLLSH